MKKNFICGLDIGNFKICAVCGTFNSQGKIDIVARQTLPAQGLREGRIVDAQRFIGCIRDLVQKLYKNYKIKIRRVYAAGISPDIKVHRCEKKLSFNAKTKIEKAHLENLVNSAVLSRVPTERRVIHIGWQNFILDSGENYFYPEGQISSSLILNISLLSDLLCSINSFIKCIKKAGLVLQGLAFSGYAQAQGLFRDLEQRTKHHVLIDVGAELTKITFLEKEMVKDVAILPFGAQSITEDIAQRFNLSFECAEKLKLRYGGVLDERKYTDQKIIVKDNSIKKTIQLINLYEIISVKVDWLLNEIKRILKELNYGSEKMEDIVFTGGGTVQEGFLERAEKILENPVKIGFLFAVNDSYIQANSAFYATSIGLIHFGWKNRNRKVFLFPKDSRLLTKIVNQTKQLYHEYF